jgi:hypothetical protein
MNSKQQTILFISAAVIFSMLLFPPFHLRLENGAEFNMGYSFLFNPPSLSTNAFGTINIGTLLVQWVAVILIAGILLLAVRNRSQD